MTNPVNNEGEKERQLRELIEAYGKVEYDSGELPLPNQDWVISQHRAREAREAIVSFVKENYIAREEHSPDCDTNDVNPDGIKKPCNCGLSGYVHMPQEKHAELLARIEAMGRLLDGVEHKHRPPPTKTIAAEYQVCVYDADCPRCAWERMKGQT